jgi:putative transposase
MTTPFLADLPCKSPVRQRMVARFFKPIKAELIWRNRWDTRRQAEGAIFQYINGFYNPPRRHSSRGGKGPLAFERKAA